MDGLKEVHVYVETDTTTPAEKQRWSGYVLECQTAAGQTVTREEFDQKTGTYHAVILQTLIGAMRRINKSCEVHIHTQDTYILNMIEKNLPLWAGNGYRNVKGDLVKNHFDWAALWKEVQKHRMVTEPGMHTYYSWMQAEVMRRKKNAINADKH